MGVLEPRGPLPPPAPARFGVAAGGSAAAGTVACGSGGAATGTLSTPSIVHSEGQPPSPTATLIRTGESPASPCPEPEDGSLGSQLQSGDGGNDSSFKDADDSGTDGRRADADNAGVAAAATAANENNSGDTASPGRMRSSRASSCKRTGKRGARPRLACRRARRPRTCTQARRSHQRVHRTCQASRSSQRQRSRRRMGRPPRCPLSLCKYYRNAATRIETKKMTQVENEYRTARIARQGKNVADANFFLQEGSVRSSQICR